MGIIGTNRADAAETVQTLLSDFREGRWPVPAKRSDMSLPPSCAGTDFADWKRIDEVERLAGGAAGRPRCKIVTVDRMIEIARRDTAVALPVQPAA
jgi:ferredoxin--NADP+ reductase